MGKTYSSLTAAQHVLNYYEDAIVMIFCPKKANNSFIKELEGKIKQSYSIFTADIKKEVEGARYIIYNHTTMHKYEEDIKEISKNHKILAIVDEVHIMQGMKGTKKVYKNGTKYKLRGTRQSRVLSRLRGCFKCVFGLSATPILNDERGLYWIINFIRPNFFGKYTNFEKKFLKTKLVKFRRGRRTIRKKEVRGFKNLKKLVKKLKYVTHIRSIKYNLEFIYRKVKISEKMKDEYIKASKGIIAEGYGYGKDEEIKDFGPRIHDLQRVVDNVQGEMDKVPLSNKEKLLCQTVTEVINRDEGSLIYVEYKDTEKRILRLLERYQDRLGIDNIYRITGSVKQKDRDYVENNLDRKDVVIINEAGAESINLRQVNNVIFYDTPFAIGNFIQIVGRITRLDTEYDFLNIYMLEVEGTIDTYKRMLIQDNAQMIKELFGRNSNLPKNTKRLDKRFMKRLRGELLWKFRER